MRRSIELIFEPKVQRFPKPEPLDVFRNDPKEKLWRISGLKDEDGSLAFALDSIRHFYYGDRDKLTNTLLNRDSRRDCGIDLYFEMSNYLLEREAWSKLLESEPLHVCYDEFVRPCRDFVSDLFLQIENRREQAI